MRNQQICICVILHSSSKPFEYCEYNFNQKYRNIQELFRISERTLFSGVGARVYTERTSMIFDNVLDF